MFDRRGFLGFSSAAFVQAALAGPAVAAVPGKGSLHYPGVNLAGGEFGNGNRLNRDYVYPSVKQVDYYASRGFRLLRIPVKGDRLVADGKPNPADVSILRAIAAAAGRHGMVIVIDLHEYALKTDGTPLTDSQADLNSLRQTWRGIAAAFSKSPNVWFGLMNEPNKQTPDVWFRLANAGIAGVRASAPDHVITVMGSRWGTADGWIQTGNAKASAALHDPSNKLVIEMHQYLDKAGGKPERAGSVPGLGASALKEATAWARAHRQKLFLGEFGMTADQAYLDEGRALLRHMYANPDVWIGYAYWAGGLWWAEGRSAYGFSIEPANLDTPKDRAQLTTLREFM
jgi:endoglucanase